MTRPLGGWPANPKRDTKLIDAKRHGAAQISWCWFSWRTDPGFSLRFDPFFLFMSLVFIRVNVFKIKLRPPLRGLLRKRRRAQSEDPIDWEDLTPCSWSANCHCPFPEYDNGASSDRAMRLSSWRHQRLWPIRWGFGLWWWWRWRRRNSNTLYASKAAFQASLPIKLTTKLKLLVTALFYVVIFLFLINLG